MSKRYMHTNIIGISSLLNEFNPLSLSNPFNFSVLVRMYKPRVFGKVFFFLAAVAMIAESLTFSVSIATLVRETITTIHLSLSLKNWNQTYKGFLKKKCYKGVLSTLLLRTQTIMMESKCSKNYFLGFYYHLSYTRVDLIC